VSVCLVILEGKGEDIRCCVDKDETGDEDSYVGEVICSDFSESITCYEE